MFDNSIYPTQITKIHEMYNFWFTKAASPKCKKALDYLKQYETYEVQL